MIMIMITVTILARIFSFIIVFKGCHLLRRPDIMRQELILGLSQAEVDYRVPKLKIYKHLADYLERCDLLHPTGHCTRVIAHPLLPQLEILNEKQTQNESQFLRQHKLSKRLAQIPALRR
jgi:hypothetical protein